MVLYVTYMQRSISIRDLNRLQSVHDPAVGCRRSNFLNQGICVQTSYKCTSRLLNHRPPTSFHKHLKSEIFFVSSKQSLPVADNRDLSLSN
ncbi:hypothetical protein L6164_004811 [Bauhinia variegata]|uniref:Uncharacterized protein n=1 Tax=Bauhinia variegata TaxID=167791 RepID=A0ACB9PQQ1_BAUVA|nr:hypothetical protein L6164_004811 [Bauhinia variegata]